MNKASPPPHSPLGEQLRIPLVAERDDAFTDPFVRTIEAEKRRALMLSLIWRMAIIGSVGLLIAASTVGGFYLARLGAKALTGF